MEQILDDELQSLLEQSRSPSFGSRKLLIRLLVAYRGTMSSRDQSILKVMMAHEDKGYTVRNVSPEYLFGKHLKASLEKVTIKVKPSAQTEDADEPMTQDDPDHSNSTKEEQKTDYIGPKKTPKHEKKESPLTVFLRQFMTKTLRRTMLNIPTDLTLTNQLELQDWDFYDVRFLLPVFYHMLSNPQVSIIEFIERHCLAITLSCLTLPDEQMRLSAYAVLSLLHRRCEDDYGHLWRMILDQLQATATLQPDEPISYLVISCLVQIIPLIHRPNHNVYDELVSFLVSASKFTRRRILTFVRTLLDLNDRQPTGQYPKLALAILRKGIRTEQDFKNCWNSGIIDLLMRSYHSPMVDASLRPAILEVFERTCTLKFGAECLLVERAFLLWLNQLMMANQSNASMLDRIKQIVKQLEAHDVTFYPLCNSELKLLYHTSLRLIERQF